MSVFKFKQFEINQNKTAMKVGTDGVLLGAWTNIQEHAKSALDIGTGTGIIALMLAQRSKAYITAIEIEENAFSQAIDNVENSKWNDRINIIHCSLQNFKPKDKYDVIVSNPPFFHKSMKSNNTAKNIARHSDSLNFDSLIKFTSLYLSKNGNASFIIPYDSKTNFISIAEKYFLYPKKTCVIKGNEKANAKRILIELTHHNSYVEENSMIIELKRHVYTEEYINLTKDFYLKM